MIPVFPEFKKIEISDKEEKVNGFRLDPENHEVHIDGDPKEVLENLVKQYEELFGKMSREICRDTARPLLAFAEEDEIPETLR